MDVKDKLEDSLEHIGAYVQTRTDLLLLNLSDKVAKSAATAAVVYVAWSLSGFVLLFLSLALAWWLGQSLDNMAAGFLIVAGIFVVITVVTYVVAKKVLRPTITNKIVKSWNNNDRQDRDNTGHQR
jgi:hypothetical protein